MKARLTRILLALMLCTYPAMGAEITDHAGYRIVIPDNPQRIVSLHDWVTTVMLTELGAPVAGTSMRVRPDGRYYIRSGEELFGLNSENSTLASVHAQTDPERVASLEPDLIMGDAGDNLKFRDQLSSIAPTIIVDPYNGMKPVELYRQVASWVARTERFDALLTAFKSHAKELRAGRDLSECRYLSMSVNARDGTLTVMAADGGLSMALEELGLQPAEFASIVPHGRSRATVSPEVANHIKADVLILGYFTGFGQSAESARADMEKVLPRFLDRMKEAGTKVMILQRETTYPITFASASRVLDAFAKSGSCAP